jgi:hypothetical protein
MQLMAPPSQLKENLLAINEAFTISFFDQARRVSSDAPVVTGCPLYSPASYGGIHKCDLIPR